MRHRGRRGGFASVNFDLHDPNNDGKLHADELQAALNNGLFDASGSVDAKLFAFAHIKASLDYSIGVSKWRKHIHLEATIVDQDKTFVDTTLLSFGEQNPPAETFVAPPYVAPPVTVPPPGQWYIPGPGLTAIQSLPTTPFSVSPDGVMTLQTSYGDANHPNDIAVKYVPGQKSYVITWRNSPARPRHKAPGPIPISAGLSSALRPSAARVTTASLSIPRS